MNACLRHFDLATYQKVERYIHICARDDHIRHISSSEITQNQESTTLYQTELLSLIYLTGIISTYVDLITRNFHHN